MMIVSETRALAGVRTVFVGVGLPNIACNLARYTVAPNLELICESGVYGTQPANARKPLICALICSMEFYRCFVQIREETMK